MSALLKVAEDRCATCLYRLKYDKATRDRLKQVTTDEDTFVACHSYSDHAGSDQAIVCRGYFDAHYEAQNGCTALQLARRFELMDGQPTVEFVPHEQYDELDSVDLMEKATP